MRASERAYVTLRDEILAWEILPGTLLSETELADRLGVSRTPLRAALARLALEGLVDTSRGRTGVVTDVSRETIVDLYELREALEYQAARLAASRRDPRVFERLAERFRDETLENGMDAYYDLVAEFDAALDEAVGNKLLRAALDNVRSHSLRARRISAANPERLLRAADEHRLICEAIRDGDGALAASATSVHLRASTASILATLDRRGSAGVGLTS